MAEETMIGVVADSMQVHNADVAEAQPGAGVGIKLSARVRKGDSVYKVVG